MRTFIFLIGSDESFDSSEELVANYNDGTMSNYNASVFKFRLRADCGTDTMTVKDIATYIGRGLAFSSDWCMDGTVSTLIEVE